MESFSRVDELTENGVIVLSVATLASIWLGDSDVTEICIGINTVLIISAMVMRRSQIRAWTVIAFLVSLFALYIQR